jgi:hypothetical protein
LNIRGFFDFSNSQDLQPDNTNAIALFELSINEGFIAAVDDVIKKNLIRFYYWQGINKFSKVGNFINLSPDEFIPKKVDHLYLIGSKM